MSATDAFAAAAVEDPGAADAGAGSSSPPLSPSGSLSPPFRWSSAPSSWLIGDSGEATLLFFAALVVRVAGCSPKADAFFAMGRSAAMESKLPAVAASNLAAASTMSVAAVEPALSAAAVAAAAVAAAAVAAAAAAVAAVAAAVAAARAATRSLHNLFFSCLLSFCQFFRLRRVAAAGAVAPAAPAAVAAVAAAVAIRPAACFTAAG